MERVINRSDDGLRTGLGCHGKASKSSKSRSNDSNMRPTVVRSAMPPSTALVMQSGTLISNTQFGGRPKGCLALGLSPLSNASQVGQDLRRLGLFDLSEAALFHPTHTLSASKSSRSEMTPSRAHSAMTTFPASCGLFVRDRAVRAADAAGHA